MFKIIGSMRGLHLFNADGKMNKLLKDVGIYCWDGVKYECSKCKYWCLV